MHPLSWFLQTESESNDDRSAASNRSHEGSLYQAVEFGTPDDPPQPLQRIAQILLAADLSKVTVTTS
jgi:hypothetical protein